MLHLLRTSLFICFGWILADTADAQTHYVLDGLTVINCAEGVYEYFLDTDASFDTTFWRIIPSSDAEIVGSDLTAAKLTFHQPGLFTLIATSITPNGLYLTDSLFILVQGFGTPFEIGGCYVENPGAACKQVCAFSTITIYGQAGFHEVFVTGAKEYETDYQSYITITWDAGGYGEVTFYGGCETTLCFEILPEPTADFSTSVAPINDTVTVCKGQEILFTNQSSDAITYQWDFGDGITETTHDAAHAYTAEGYFTASLTAYGICDCHAEKQIVVEVLPSPAPTLDCVNSVCPGTRQRYTSTSDCSLFYWTVSSNGTIVNGGGVNDDFIEVIWNSGPDGIIELSVDECATAYCSFVNSFRIPVITPDGPIEGDASVCAAELVTYTVPYFPGTQYVWSLGPAGSIVSGDNTHAIAVQWQEVSANTNTHVKVEYDNCFHECGGEDLLPVTIVPEIHIAGDVQVCQGEEASVMATAGFLFPLNVNVRWSIEDESGNVLFTSPIPDNEFSHIFFYPAGNYVWVATNTNANYCNDEVRLIIQVTAEPSPPLDILGERIICPGVLYGYTVDAAGAYNTYWNVVDGAANDPYFGQSFNHSFDITPPYAIGAWHADLQFNTCISDTTWIALTTLTDYIIEGPQDNCFNSISSFSIASSSGVDYVWEIVPTDAGEIRRSNVNEVDIFWTRDGAATVRLHACGLTIDKPVIIHPLPDFTVLGISAVCPADQATLTTTQPTLEHTWLDDNQIFQGALPTISVGPGVYSVSLKDSYGCVNDTSFEITAFPVPVVNLSTPDPVYYCNIIAGGVNLVANTDGTGYSFTWYKDDVSIGPGGPVYSATDFGEYHVEVINQYGCKAISLKIKIVNCCPPNTCSIVLGGGPPLGCLVILTDFNIDKTELDCQHRIYTPLLAGIEPNTSQWRIASASRGIFDIETVEILDYTYLEPGYYTLALINELTGYPYDATHCAHGQIFADTIRAVADFAIAGTCAASNIQFEDLTTFLPDESIASWNWNFGDPSSGAGNISNGQDPIHAYESGGDYTITLTITLASGCTSTKTQQHHIADGPALTPVFEPVYCEKEAYAFSVSGNLFDVHWEFGDPVSGVQNSAGSEAVFHTYDNAGLYSVIVSAYDVFGCKSQVSIPADVRANTLSGTIAVDPTTYICYGDTATLTAPAAVEWLWSNDETSQIIQVTESNQYGVLISDIYHCTYSPPPVFVDVKPIPEIVISAHVITEPGIYGPWQNALAICYGTEFELQAFSSTFGSYHWLDGQVTEVISFTDEGGNLPLPGIYSYGVYSINGFGCASDTAYVQVEIYDLPLSPTINLISGSGCSFDDNMLAVTAPQPGVTYTWSDGQEGNVILVKQAGSFFVVAKNAFGCTSVSNSIVIEPSAPVDQIPAGCFVKCNPLKVCLPDIQPITSYSLYHNGVLIDSGTSFPDDYFITSDGSYVIEVTTPNGCTATSDPLDIVLYPGVGSITVLTYLDTDGNGIISTGDVLIPGIPVEIISIDPLYAGMSATGADGSFVFEDYPTNTYTALFNAALLPSIYEIVIDSVTGAIVMCDDSIVVSLLVRENCTVAGPDQYIEICIGEDVMVGDSVLSDMGTYEIHMTSVGGCDSVWTAHIYPHDTIEIHVTVWVDVDENGVFSPADTVIQGITIVIDRGIGQAPFIVVTDEFGFANGYYNDGPYIISIDSTLLPSGFEIIYGLDFVPDTACLSDGFNFLLGTTCSDVLVLDNESLCPGDSLLIQGEWLSEPGLYSYVIDQPGDCDTLLDVNVSLYPIIYFEVSTVWNCIELGSIALTVEGDGPFETTWDPVIPNDSIVTGLDPGNYAFHIEDINGCTTGDTVIIEEEALLEFGIDSFFEVDSGEQVVIHITGDGNEPGLSFIWSAPGILNCDTCASVTATPLSDTVVSVVITDAFDCTYELSTLIIIREDSTFSDELYVPNVFTPNGDGVNDHWTMYSRLPDAVVSNLVIFDRWGNMVFEKKEFVLNEFTGWDGTFKDQKMNAGVFAFTGRVTLSDGVVRVVKGDITLVR